jgi:hypothetical protein
MTVIYDRFAEDLKELADIECQKRDWLALGKQENRGRESSLVEVGCRLFVDSGLGSLLKSGSIVFDAKIDADLRKLREMIEALYYRVNSVDDLGSAEMQDVRTQARRILVSVDRQPEAS